MLAVARPKKTGVPRLARTYRLPEDLIAALEKLAESNRRPVTTEIEIAVEEYCKAHRVWTPRQPKIK